MIHTYQVIFYVVLKYVFYLGRKRKQASPLFITGNH